MTTASNQRLVQPRHVILMVAAGFVLVLATAFVYRLTHPSLTQTPGQPRHSAADHDDEQQAAAGQRDMTGVRELMVKLSEDPDNPEVLKALGREFMHMQAWDQAKGFLEKAVTIKPSDTDAMMMLGVALFNMQSYREAADQFELIVSLDPANAMAKYNLGVIYKYGLKDPETARGYFEQVVDSDKVSEDIRNQAAEEIKTQ